MNQIDALINVVLVEVSTSIGLSPHQCQLYCIVVAVDTMTNEEEIGSVLEELFYKLRGLGTARKTLKQFRY